MDPFSITVGTLTLAGAVTATAKMTSALLRLRDVPEEIKEIFSEVISQWYIESTMVMTEFQLQKFESLLARTRSFKEKLLAADGSDQYVRMLHGIEDRANSVVFTLRIHLKQLLRSAKDGPLNAGDANDNFSKRAWLKNRRKIFQCCGYMKIIREEITAEIVTAASWVYFLSLKSDC